MQPSRLAAVKSGRDPADAGRVDTLDQLYQAHDAIIERWGAGVNWGTPELAMRDVWERAREAGIVTAKQFEIAKARAGWSWHLRGSRARITA